MNDHLISRNKFLDALVLDADNKTDLIQVHHALEKAVISPDDVRGVVLCKDCDCWNEWDHAGRKSLGNYVCSCAHWTVEDGAVLYTKPTDFCSYGERKVSEDA